MDGSLSILDDEGLRGGLFSGMWEADGSAGVSGIETFAEVESGDIGIGVDFFGGSVGENFAFSNDVGSVADFESFAELVVSE